MDIPHELRDEFPQEISLVERMIRTNYEFRRLAERYDEVNRNIYRIESGEERSGDARAGDKRDLSQVRPLVYHKDRHRNRARVGRREETQRPPRGSRKLKSDHGFVDYCTYQAARGTPWTSRPWPSARGTVGRTERAGSAKDGAVAGRDLLGD
jgi:uncharacterized protein